MSKIDTSKRKTYVEYLLPFFLLFSQYVIYGVPISTLLLSIVAVLTILKNGLRLYKHYLPFVIFFAYVLLHDICAVLFGGSDPNTAMNRLLEYTVNYILIFVVCSVPLNEDKLFSAWKIATILYSAGLIYHLVLIHILGQPVQIIQIMPLLRDINLNEPYRPRSFFNEPSYIASALLPMLFLSLKRKNFFWAALTTGMIFLTTSTAGVVLAMIMWGLNYFFGSEKKKKVWPILVFAALLVVFTTSELFLNSYEKLQSVLSGGSTFIPRVIIGLEIVKTLPFWEFFAGTLYNEVADYIYMNSAALSNRIILRYWSISRNAIFMNGISSLIFRYGLVGLFMFFSTYKGMLFKKNFGGRIFAIITLISLFANSEILNAPYYINAMILLLYLNTIECKEDCDEKISLDR